MEKHQQVLLIYIPCHIDFDAAVDQAKVIRKEFLQLRESEKRDITKIEIIISVNNYSPSKTQIDFASKYADLIQLNNDLFLADANIANGFILASQRNSDFLWLLSANDKLLNNGLAIILRSISPTNDLVVAAIPNIEKITVLNSVIHPQIKGYAFGLISGVIYNCATLSSFFNSSQFFIWTGWSQLSVIQNAIDQKGSLSIATVNIYEIYEQRQTSPIELRSKYGHSFFGYILIGSIFAKSKKERKKFIKKYVFKNAFKFSLYTRKTTRSSKIIDHSSYLSWNQDLAESVIKKSSCMVYLFYKLANSFPFWIFKSKYKYVDNIS